MCPKIDWSVFKKPRDIGLVLGVARSRLCLFKAVYCWTFFSKESYNVFNRITSKWQCPWNERWCSTQPLIQYEFPGRENKGYDVTTFGLSKMNVGYIWWITKVRVKTV